EAVRRIWEGAAMIRTRGEAGTGDIVEAVRHIRLVTAAIAELKAIDNDRLLAVATKFSDSYTRLLKEVRTAHGQDASVHEADVVFAGATLDDITEGTFQLLTEIKNIERLVYPVPGHGGHRTRALGGRTKVRLVRDDDDGDVREHPFDFLEETKLVDDRITACLGRIEEEEHAIRHMGQGRDRLPFHRVPFLHRAIEQAGGVEDLKAVQASVEVPERDAFRREGVVCDLGPAGRDRADERALPHVGITRDHDGPDLRVDLGELSQRAPRLDEGVEI